MATHPPARVFASHNHLVKETTLSDPDLDKLVQELRERRKLKYMADCKCGNCQCVHIDTVYAAADALTAARGRVKELEGRLEMNHAWRLVDGKTTRVPVEPGSIPDGIDCRDETIRQQDRIIDELRTRIAALEEALRALANATDDVGVKYFDTDTMEPLVERMNESTLAARRALGGKDG